MQKKRVHVYGWVAPKSLEMGMNLNTFWSISVVFYIIDEVWSNFYFRNEYKLFKRHRLIAATNNLVGFGEAFSAQI